MQNHNNGNRLELTYGESGMGFMINPHPSDEARDQSVTEVVLCKRTGTPPIAKILVLASLAQENMKS